MKSYEDMLCVPHPVSTSHKPMPREQRAAQFAPFAALVGHDAAIAETARLTERRVELSDTEREVLDRVWRYVQTHPTTKIAVTYFQPDAQKDGGAYLCVSGYVNRTDDIHGYMVLSGVCIPFRDVISIDLQGKIDKN